MAGMIAIGISGLQAAQLSLTVAQHNIANANTTGYNRQTVIQTSSAGVGTSAGFTGNGVTVSTIQRQYNTFLSEQVLQSSTQFSSLDAYSGQIQVIDNLLADSSAGVSPALQSFFTSVQAVAAAPASTAARQSMVSSAQSLVARLQSVDQRITDLYGQANQQITDDVTQINSYAQQIAALNERITTAESAVNQPANDLRDQRDQLIADLNKKVKVQTVSMGAAGIEVFIGKGQLLVMGTQVNQLSAVRSSSDPSRISLALDAGSGKQELPDNLITGGELGGLLSFRSETLDKAVNSLGKFAASLALTFNAQHATGMDMLGNELGDSKFAADFFTLPDPTVVASNATGPIVTAKLTPAVLSSNDASGNYTTDLTNSDYRLEFNANQFTLTRLSDNTAWTAADLTTLNAQISDRTDPRGAQGFSLADNGTAYSSGDSFLIEPTRDMAKNIGINTSIAGDVRLVAAALPVRASVDLTNTGSMQVSISRVRTDSTTSIPGPAYPVKIGVSADGASLTLGDSNGPYSVTNVGPLQVTVYKSGAAPVTYSLDYPASSNPPPVGSGLSYEIADGNRRVLFSTQGNPKAGDTFSLDMNDASTGGSIGVSDTGNMLLLGKLQTQNTADGGATNYQGIYDQLVSDIGNKANEIDVTKTAQKSLLDQATTAQQADSGVNLDEEAANLIKFQQMYQASARSISVGQKLFDALLAIAGG